MTNEEMLLIAIERAVFTDNLPFNEVMERFEGKIDKYQFIDLWKKLRKERTVQRRLKEIEDELKKINSRNSLLRKLQAFKERESELKEKMAEEELRLHKLYERAEELTQKYDSLEKYNEETVKQKKEEQTTRAHMTLEKTDDGEFCLEPGGTARIGSTHLCNFSSGPKWYQTKEQDGKILIASVVRPPQIGKLDPVAELMRAERVLSELEPRSEPPDIQKRSDYYAPVVNVLKDAEEKLDDSVLRLELLNEEQTRLLEKAKEAGFEGLFKMKFVGKPGERGAPGNYKYGHVYKMPYRHSQFSFWELVEP